MIRARGWLWAVQLAVAGAVVALVAGSLARNWTAFRAVHVALAVRPALLAAAVLAVCATYAVQIEAWRRILAGWRQRIGFGAAARIWSLANLGRYLPGKVWSVAGLVLLARRAGVDAARPAGRRSRRPRAPAGLVRGAGRRWERAGCPRGGTRK